MKAAKTTGMPSKTIRPAFEDIFTHKMCDERSDPYSAATEHYSAWASDHKGQMRFYIKGWHLVQRLTGQVSNRRYYDMADAAAEAAKDDPAWRIHTVNIGGAKISEQQFGRPPKGKCVTYDRAGIMILAAELLYREVAGDDTGPFYKAVSILPACYNIDKFNSERWANWKKTQPKLPQIIMEQIGQDRDPKLLDEMASGCCVTFATAMAVKKVLVENVAASELGDVRPRPGSKTLGRGQASLYEEPEL